MDSVADLAKAVKDAAEERDGRLTLQCRQAFEVAASHGVAPARVGQLCNENGIKIVTCQLGCFK